MSITEEEPVQLGKFPYPYQAAFAVASDIDGASLARFRAVHALFCGNETINPETADWRALGVSNDCSALNQGGAGIQGLGLDFADSFFLVGDRTTFGMHRHCPELDCFQEDQQDGKKCGRLIWQWLKTGQIDSFHAFLHYTRKQIAPLLREFYDCCEREGIRKPKVWLNHSLPMTPTGLCPRSLQPNPIPRLIRLSARKMIGPLFGRPRFPLRYAFAQYQGDDPKSAYYVNDLLAANGLRYVWLNMGDLHRNRMFLPEFEHNNRKTILEPVTMGDGVRYYRFERCYGKPAGRFGGEAYLRDSEAGFDSSSLITPANLEALWRAEGTCILYVHWTHPRSFPIPSTAIAQFELLRRWRDAGKIWITSTSKLLEWTRLRTFLRVVSRREGKRLTVEIDGLDDPIFGREQVTLDDLNGLCLMLASPSQETTVVVRGAVIEPNQGHRCGNLYWIDAHGDLAGSRPAANSPRHVAARS